MKKNTYPLISVIIPTYKRAHFLGRAIDSVLNQTYPNTEIIVVDDNDPDSIYRKKTEQIMLSYQNYNNVHYICHPYNRNGAAARNTGLAGSSGKYICFLDDDDWYLPDKLLRQYEYLRINPNFAAVYCGYSRNGHQNRPYKYGDLSFELLSGTDIIYTNTIMIDREEALKCGGWDERFRRNQEAVFLLRYFTNGGQIGALADILVEFDTSDAINRSDPVQFEKDFDFFLEIHQQEIENCKTRYANARQLIYCYRYRGVLLNYIKYGYFREALQLYKKMCHMYPKYFGYTCFLYVKRRILNQPLFKEFEKEFRKKNECKQ